MLVYQLHWQPVQQPINYKIALLTESLNYGESFYIHCLWSLYDAATAQIAVQVLI